MELISGQTVIARITAREGAESFPVDIVYMSETEGRINMPDGSTKIISGARYQKFLENYHEKMKLEEREKQLSRIIPPSESEKDDESFFDEEEGDYGYDIFDDEDALYEDEDPEEERMPVVARRREVPDRRFETKKKKKVTKAYPEEEASRKKPMSKTARIAIIAVVAVVLLAGALFLARALMKKGDSPSNPPASAMTVAVLKTDLAQGTALTEEMIESRKLSEEDYEILSNTTFVSADGKTYTGTLVSWDDRSSLVGGVALRTIEAGNVLMAEDLAKKEADGTVTESAQPMQMRIVAIISSDQLKEDVMVELGKYVFEAGQLKDILDETNESLIPESETTTAEAESK